MNDCWSVVVSADSVWRKDSWQKTISTSALSTAVNTQKSNYWWKCKQNESKIIFILIVLDYWRTLDAYFFFTAVIWCCYLERYSLQESLWSILPWFAGREIAVEFLNVFYWRVKQSVTRFYQFGESCSKNEQPVPKLTTSIRSHGRMHKCYIDFGVNCFFKLTQRDLAGGKLCQGASAKTKGNSTQCSQELYSSIDEVLRLDTWPKTVCECACLCLCVCGKQMVEVDTHAMTHMPPLLPPTPPWSIKGHIRPPTPPDSIPIGWKYLQ